MLITISFLTQTLQRLSDVAPGRRQRITDELGRARAAKGGWIDTDFYKGFLQVPANGGNVMGGVGGGEMMCARWLMRTTV